MMYIILFAQNVFVILIGFKRVSITFQTKSYFYGYFQFIHVNFPEQSHVRVRHQLLVLFKYHVLETIKILTGNNDAWFVFSTRFLLVIRMVGLLHSLILILLYNALIESIDFQQASNKYRNLQSSSIILYVKVLLNHSHRMDLIINKNILIPFIANLIIIIINFKGKSHILLFHF